jgi:hypothetical protein
MAAGCVWRPLWAPALLLNVVALAQVTWPLWLRPGVPGVRLLEWALAALALGATAAAIRHAFGQPQRPGPAC